MEFSKGWRKTRNEPQNGSEQKHTDALFPAVSLRAHISLEGYLSHRLPEEGDNQTKLSRQATLLQGTVLETGFMI